MPGSAPRTHVELRVRLAEREGRDRDIRSVRCWMSIPGSEVPVEALPMDKVIDDTQQDTASLPALQSLSLVLRARTAQLPCTTFRTCAVRLVVEIELDGPSPLSLDIGDLNVVSTW